MAKYKVNVKFEGLQEGKVFNQGEEIDMTVTRAEEIQKNISERYKGKFGEVLERLDVNDNADDKKDDGKKVDEKKVAKKDDGEAK